MRTLRFWSDMKIMKRSMDDSLLDETIVDRNTVHTDKDGMKRRLKQKNEGRMY